jgi:transposase
MYQREGMGRLTTIPGVGPITAAAVKALVADIAGLKSARHFAAWTGLTPKSHWSDGKEGLGSISKMGNVTLRTSLTAGADHDPPNSFCVSKSMRDPLLARGLP